MAELAGYTADQWGLVTTAQANAAGVDNSTLHRLVEEGLLDRVTRGVYAATSAVEDPLRRHRAAWLLLDPTVPAWRREPLSRDGGVVSHRSATIAFGVGDLVEDRVELTVPRRRTTRNTEVRLRVRPLARDDVTEVDGLPVTTVERTVDDLLEDGVDGGHVGDVISHALRRGLTTGERLVPRLGRHGKALGVRGRDGERVLEHLLDQATNADITAVPVKSLTAPQRWELVRSVVAGDEPTIDFPRNLVHAFEAMMAQQRAPLAEAAAQIADIVGRDQRAVWEQLSESVRAATQEVNAKVTRDFASLQQAIDGMGSSAIEELVAGIQQSDMSQMLESGRVREQVGQSARALSTYDAKAVRDVQRAIEGNAAIAEAMARIHQEGQPPEADAQKAGAKEKKNPPAARATRAKKHTAGATRAKNSSTAGGTAHSGKSLSASAKPSAEARGSVGAED